MRRALLLLLAGCPEELVPVEPMIPVLVAPCDAPVPLDLGPRTHTVLRLGGEAVFFRLELQLRRRVSVAVSSDREVEGALFAEACPVGEPIAGPGIAFEGVLDPGAHLIGVFGPPDAEVELSVALGAAPEVMVPPSCAAPILLDLSGGHATASGTFEDAEDVGESSCSTNDAKDVVFQIDLTEPADVEAETNGDSIFFFLRGAPCESGTELVCASYERLIVPHLEAGSYFLFVEQYYDGMTYDVTVTKSPPTPRPTHDRCETAMELPDPSGGVLIESSFLAAEPREFGQCGGNVALYYALTLDRPSQLEVLDRGSSAELSLWDACSVELRCDSYAGLCAESLPPGRYVIRAARPYDADPDYALALEVASRPAPLPAANDTCENAREILSNPEVVDDSFAGSIDDTLFYRLTLSERSDVTLEVEYPAYAELLGQSCAAPVEDRRYENTYYGIGPGSFFVRAQTALEECGPTEAQSFSLTIASSPAPPPPPNDTCAAPEVIAFPGGLGSTVIVSGNTAGASNDIDWLGCGYIEPDPAPAPDLFYQLELPVDARLRIAAIETPSGTRLSLHTLACDDVHALSCWLGSTDPLPYGLPAGTYFLRLEHSIEQSPPGEFSYEVSIFEP